MEGGEGKSYKPPVADPAIGLDLSKLPPPDAGMSKLNITMPVSSTLAQVGKLGTSGEAVHWSSKSA